MRRGLFRRRQGNRGQAHFRAGDLAGNGHLGRAPGQRGETFPGHITRVGQAPLRIGLRLQLALQGVDLRLHGLNFSDQILPGDYRAQQIGRFQHLLLHGLYFGLPNTP